LKQKKNAFIQIFRKDPRVSREKEILSLVKLIEDFDPINPKEEPEFENTFRTVICERFSNHNENVILSSCERSLKLKSEDGNKRRSHCFLNVPKIEENQILKWTIEVPKFRCVESVESYIGMVINWSNQKDLYVDLAFTSMNSL